MEVDAGSNVITLLVPFVMRIFLPLSLIVAGVGAVLALLAFLFSLDVAAYKLLAGWIPKGEPLRQD
jgi:hypothetical protein